MIVKPPLLVQSLADIEPGSLVMKERELGIVTQESVRRAKCIAFFTEHDGTRHQYPKSRCLDGAGSSLINFVKTSCLNRN
jgi:hypothetical protein